MCAVQMRIKGTANFMEEAEDKGVYDQTIIKVVDSQLSRI